MEEIDKDMDIYSYLKEIHLAANRSSKLTQQLLSFARKEKILLEVLDISNHIVKFTPMVKQLLGENISLSLELDPQISKIHINPSHIEQI